MEALILDTKPSGEADMLVRLLLRDGRRIDALARSAREMSSKLRAGLLPLTIADVGLIGGRKRWIAKSVRLQAPFFGVWKTETTQSVARLLASMLGIAIIETPDANVYPKVVRALRELHVAGLSNESQLLLRRRAAVAWIQTLGALGLEPTFEQSEKGALSDQAARALENRQIPQEAKDVTALLEHLSEHSMKHLPEVGPLVSWVRSTLEIPVRAHLGTMGGA